MFYSHKSTSCFQFCFLNSFNIFLCKFLFVFWLTTLSFMFSCYLLVLGLIFLLCLCKLMLISFYSHIFLLFYHWPTYLTLGHVALKVLVFLVSLSTCSVIYSENMRSIGQTLIMCLKCSRASFLPSSYSEKMCLGRGYKCTITANNCAMKQSVHRMFR